jgi:branched-chain amino acid transport system ATP-binding protein
MLEIEDLHVSYGHVQALKGVSLRVQPGEIVTLVGANGAGKSTLVKTVAGLVRPQQGRIRFEGEELGRVPAHQIVRRGIGYSPEGRRVFPLLTVDENLEIGAYTRNRSELKGDKERVYGLFPRLTERLKSLGGTLSGGEQQMLAIGRALMSRPKLLLLDEPSLGLGPTIVTSVFKLIRDLNATGIAILLVEQNALKALNIANQGYVLETGKIVLADRAANLANHPDIRQIYLGM